MKLPTPEKITYQEPVKTNEENYIGGFISQDEPVKSTITITPAAKDTPGIPDYPPEQLQKKPSIGPQPQD